jgi:hypothetical protein
LPKLDPLTPDALRRSFQTQFDLSCIQELPA